MGADVASRLVRCFTLAFPDLGREDIPRAAVTRLRAWDSMATVTLVALIEEEFGVSVDPDDVEDFVSFEFIRDYLQRKLEPDERVGMR
jgi:acyl carrier protein